MAKQDYIPAGIRRADWSDGVMENWNDGPQRFLPTNPTIHQSNTPFPPAHPAYTAAFGNLLGIVGPEDTTDISTLKPQITGEDKKGGVVEIDFNLANSEGVNIYSRRDGDADFKFLARDTSPTYVDNRALLVANKPEIREYKAVFVVGDIEVSQFSDEITVNCAPLV